MEPPKPRGPTEILEGVAGEDLSYKAVAEPLAGRNGIFRLLANEAVVRLVEIVKKLLEKPSFLVSNFYNDRINRRADSPFGFCF